MPQQPLYGTHRASHSGAPERKRTTQDDVPDLSGYDALARSSVNNVQIQDIVKSEQALPWVGAHQAAHQIRQLPQPPLHAQYAKSEPPTKHDLFSETADSGYQTQYHTAPTPAHNSFSWTKQALEQNHHFLVAPTPDMTPDRQSTVSHSHVIRGLRDGRKKLQLNACPWPGCGRVPRNLSDAKKHELTHTRPYCCKEPGCSRKDGFATDNDLQRHRKSVHNKQPTVGNPAGYICIACTVSEGTQPKFWPRRDNFKAHIKRKHPNYNDEELIERSKQHMRPDGARTADEDARTVRSALQSAAHHSQADPEEKHGYQLYNSPGVSRHPSDQGNYTGSLWPTANSPMFTSAGDDVLAGMSSHTADLQQYLITNDMGPNVANGLNGMSDVVNDFDIQEDSSYGQQPPSKRAKTSQPPSLGFMLPPNHEHNLDLAESQNASSSSTTLSAMSPFQTTGDFPCPDCNKVKKRECDLKKHMKRHTRPYGCTFPNCQKKFGSRNDWKRHETTQHFLPEMWKCQCRRVDGADCVRRPFHHLELLKKHLRGKDHRMQDEGEIDEKCKEFRLGRDGGDHFWCGFCNKLISQDRELHNAPDERLKHIGDHFDKGNCDGGDWVCIDEGKPKKYITQEDRKEAKRRAKTGFREDDENEGELPDYMASNAFGSEMNGMFSSHKRSFEDGAGGLNGFRA